MMNKKEKRAGLPQQSAQSGQVLAALGEAWAWAYYPGHAEGEAPPPADPARVAGWVRVILSECSRLADNTATALAIFADNARLTADAATYRRELTRLRVQLGQEVADPANKTEGKADGPTTAQASGEAKPAATGEDPARGAGYYNPEDYGCTRRRGPGSASADDDEGTEGAAESPDQV